ncbi:TatD family hydrolase [Aerococcaceae bacterium WGS1372]
MKLFDTHTHLNADQFEGIEYEIITSAHNHHVDYMAVVGFDEKTINKSLKLSQAYNNIISVLGWHPTEAYRYNKDIELMLIHKLTADKVQMLGEIGLDYYWPDSTKEEQRKVFRRLIAIAKEMNLPITIHNRDATEDVYNILKEEGIPEAGGIMHSFGESSEEVKKFLDLGMHISFSGVLTFKKTNDVREAAKLVPDDKLLIETDAPYLAPVPMRGKRNEPAYVRYVAEVLAEVRETSLDNIADITTKNAFRLFDWNPED